MGPRSQPRHGAAARGRTTRQWPPDREACTAHQRERSEKLQERERAGSASVADTARVIRSFTRGAPGRLDGGTAPVARGEGLLVLLQELRHLTRDSSLGSSGELEDSCCLGKSRPPACQMHAAAGHVVTILIAPTSCQAVSRRIQLPSEQSNDGATFAIHPDGQTAVCINPHGETTQPLTPMARPPRATPPIATPPSATIPRASPPIGKAPKAMPPSEMMPIATPPIANPPTAMSPTAMTPRATPHA